MGLPLKMWYFLAGVMVKLLESHGYIYIYTYTYIYIFECMWKDFTRHPFSIYVLRNIGAWNEPQKKRTKQQVGFANYKYTIYIYISSRTSDQVVWKIIVCSMLQRAHPILLTHQVLHQQWWGAETLASPEFCRVNRSIRSSINKSKSIHAINHSIYLSIHAIYIWRFLKCGTASKPWMTTVVYCTYTVIGLTFSI